MTDKKKAYKSTQHAELYRVTVGHLVSNKYMYIKKIPKILFYLFFFMKTIKKITSSYFFVCVCVCVCVHKKDHQN